MVMTQKKFKAEVSLPSDSEVEVTRDFKAPRTLVWQAHTDSKLMQRWLVGMPGWSMPVCEMDVRPGGSYHYGPRLSEDAPGDEQGDDVAPGRLADLFETGGAREGVVRPGAHGAHHEPDLVCSELHVTARGAGRLDGRHGSGTSRAPKGGRRLVRGSLSLGHR